MAVSYLNCEPTTRASDLTIRIFFDSLKNGKERKYPLEYFQKALDFTGCVPPYSKNWEPIDRSHRTWKHTLALAQFTIYLIDFYQEQAQDPQWEEHRVFLVKLVKQWNVDSNQKSRYMYVHGDMATKNYIDTFPSKRTSMQSAFFSSTTFWLVVASVGINAWLGIACWFSMVGWSVCAMTLCASLILVFLESKWSLFSRAKKYWDLNLRGSRFGRRHYPKRISSKGATIKAAHKSHVVKLDDDLQTVHQSVMRSLDDRILSK